MEQQNLMAEPEPEPEKEDDFFGPDLNAICSREKLGLSDEWEVFRWEILHDQVKQISLGVPGVYKKGPRKGRKKFNRKAAKVAIFSLDEFAQWCEKWSERTGNCLRCRGSGNCWTGWSRAEGTKSEKCKKCGGTGKREV